MPAFKYTDEEWAEIRAMLGAQPRGHLYTGRLKSEEDIRRMSKPRRENFLRNQREFTERCRANLETKITAWMTVAPEHRSQTQQICKQVGTFAQYLRFAYETGKDYFGHIFPNDPKFWDQLKQIEDAALVFAQPLKGRKNFNRHRNNLLSELMAAWLIAGGGAVRTSTGDTPDSPLVRFLMKAARPAGVKLTPWAADRYISEYGASFKRATGAKSLDGIEKNAKTARK